MRVYVLTRGVTKDYRYLGSPIEPWWQAFERLTAFENPSLLVHADQAGWRVYAAAIPTARRDRVDTVIRISLALAGEHEPNPNKPGQRGFDGVLALIRAWLDEPDVGGSSRLTELLDEQFPAKDTERFIDNAGSDNDEELCRRVCRALDRLARWLPRSDARNGSTPAIGSSWVGDVTVSENRAAFAERARALLTGDARGWAVQLNLAGAGDIDSRFRTTDEPLVALVDERIAGGRGELHPKAPALESRARRRRKLIAAAILVIVGVIGLAAWLLTQAQSRPAVPVIPPSVSPS